ncbi:MAG: ribosome maturation factor RimP [Ruminococcaceae bacterium]|jgi:ribosome maturation factor RimP|nr:ribosome maturation factor RimP [Oscillospiraceae bacterium]
MKEKKGVARTVWELAEPLCGEFGYILWDVEYVREGADMILRVTIDTDREGGITIDDCEKLHRALDPVLDEADPIEEAYMLAVSSPGVERTLTEPFHFERMAGSDVMLKFYAAVNGSKSLRATLEGLDPATDEIVVTVGGEEKRFPKKSVAKCETVFDW